MIARQREIPRADACAAIETTLTLVESKFDPRPSW